MKAKGPRSRLGVFSRFGIILLLAIVAVCLLARRDRSNPSELAQRSTEPTQKENQHSAAVPPSRSSNTTNPSGSAASSQPAATNLGGEAVPEHVQTWLRERLTAESFAGGIALLKDQSLSEQARVLILDKLHSWRRYLTPDNLKVLFAETELIAKDATQPRELRSRAVSAMATILVVLQEQNLFSPGEVQAYASFLTELSQAKEADLLVRGRAIRALGILKADNAGPMLRELLATPENVNNQELARNACLALAQVDGVASVPTISRVLETTSDDAVFGTAAFALGQIQTPESLAALVRNESRFPGSGSADAALVNMEDLILRILQRPEDPNIASAIEATRHLWKDGQRDKYTPLLRALVASSQLTAQQAAIGRLIEESRSMPLEQEQRALSLILPSIANNPQLADYTQQIENRLNAKPLVPNAATIPTVGRSR
ncbi:MAG: HEAT repeat domain-containing protein [Verrucomicrobia bacterium]|jgi:HEAT repeat protein|nr:HEAT repeat domain-containing protein [Verrucomicrobiota bacterium]